MPSDATWLFRFGDKHWTDHLKKAAQDFKFQATLKPRMDAEIEDWHKSQPPAVPPPIQIDDLHIRAPWHDQQKTDNP